MFTLPDYQIFGLFYPVNYKMMLKKRIDSMNYDSSFKFQNESRIDISRKFENRAYPSVYFYFIPVFRFSRAHRGSATYRARSTLVETREVPLLHLANLRFRIQVYFQFIIKGHVV